MRIVSAVVLAVLLPIAGRAQTCSCAGAPLLGSLEAAATPRGSFQLGITYQRHAINDLVSDSESIDRVDRTRTTDSFLLEVRIGITRSLSATALLPVVTHRRCVDTDLGSDKLTSFGQGDLLLLAKYSPMRASAFSPYESAVGIGVKLPIGASTLRSQGILLSEDMQPGTGAWDGVLWGYAARAIHRSGASRIYSSLSYRRTGTNGREYRFGSELLSVAGFTHQVTPLIGYSVAGRHRWTGPDRRAGSDMPNTGGSWLSVAPTVSLTFTPSVLLRANIEAPIIRDVAGTQFTTSYAASVAVFYTL